VQIPPTQTYPRNPFLSASQPEHPREIVQYVAGTSPQHPGPMPEAAGTLAQRTPQCCVHVGCFVVWLSPLSVGIGGGWDRSAAPAPHASCRQLNTQHSLSKYLHQRSLFTLRCFACSPCRGVRAWSRGTLLSMVAGVLVDVHSPDALSSTPNHSKGDVTVKHSAGRGRH